MSPVESDFVSISPSQVKVIWLADHSNVPVLGQGIVAMEGPQGRVLIHDVLFVPNLSARLLSFASVYNHRGRVTFSRRGDNMNIYVHRVSAPVLQGVRLGNAWYVEGPILSQSMPGAN